MSLSRCPPNRQQANQIAAYRALPEKSKERIEGLNLIYKFTRDSLESRFGDHQGRRLRLSPAQEKADTHSSAASRVVHPMVFTQEQTGRKVINVSPWFVDGIEGMENEEGDALLREIVLHVIKPERVYYHKWVPGEMVLWDNWRMLHCATGTPLGMKRHIAPHHDFRRLCPGPQRARRLSQVASCEEPEWSASSEWSEWRRLGPLVAMALGDRRLRARDLAPEPTCTSLLSWDPLPDKK
jgi:hypothetical protein